MFYILPYWETNLNAPSNIIKQASNNNPFFLYASFHLIFVTKQDNNPLMFYSNEIRQFKLAASTEIAAGYYWSN